MNSPASLTRSPRALASIVLALSLATSLAATAPPPAGDEPAVHAAHSGDAALAPWRARLLDVAFEAASAMPTHPHVKNRCRAQEAVVDACIQLDQTERAVEWAGRIDNWRRGTAFADGAAWFAKHGRAEEARRWIEMASKVAEAPGNEESQDWQHENIVAAIARAQAAFDAPVATGAASLPTQAALDAQLAAVDEVVRTGNMDEVRGVLQSCTKLFDLCYADAAMREQAAGKIRSSWKPLPIDMRIDMLAAMVGFAADHEDPATALRLAREAGQVKAELTWLPEDDVRQLARLATLRFRAGDAEGAREQAAAALVLYQGQRDAIVDVFRAGALRPLAEAWQSFGDADQARSIYARALEDGALNPNARPRAEDLAATCCSMALHDVEPGAALQARITELAAGLKAPW